MPGRVIPGFGRGISGLIFRYLKYGLRVGVVEQLRKPFDGDNALTEEIGDVVADVAAEQEIEVVAMEAVVVLCGGARIAHTRWIYITPFVEVIVVLEIRARL